MRLELRAIMNSDVNYDSAVIMSSHHAVGKTYARIAAHAQKRQNQR